MSITLAGYKKCAYSAVSIITQTCDNMAINIILSISLAGWVGLPAVRHCLSTINKLTVVRV